MHVRHPLHRLRPLEQRAVLAVPLIEHLVREVNRRPFIHERFRVAVGADVVVPPLVAGLVRDEILDVIAAEVRHAEDAFVDHHEAGALIAVPAEVRFRDGELRVGERAEPVREHRYRVGHDLQHLGGVVLVLGECHHTQRQHPAIGQLHLALEFLVARAAQEREVAAEERLGLDQLAAIGQLGFGLDRGRAGEHFVLRHVELRGEDAGFVEPRLRPRNERRRVPTGIVADREQGQRVGDERYAFPVTPAALLVRQVQAEADLDFDRFARREGLRQREAERGRVVVVELVMQKRGLIEELAAGAEEPGLADDAVTAAPIDGLRRVHAEEFERLGEEEVVAGGHAVVRIEVQDELFEGLLGRVRPGDLLADVGAMADLIERDVEVVVRQVVRLDVFRGLGARGGKRGERNKGDTDPRSQFYKATDAHQLPPTGSGQRRIA